MANHTVHLMKSSPKCGERAKPRPARTILLKPPTATTTSLLPTPTWDQS